MSIQFWVDAAIGGKTRTTKKKVVFARDFLAHRAGMVFGDNFTDVKTFLRRDEKGDLLVSGFEVRLKRSDGSSFDEQPLCDGYALVDTKEPYRDVQIAAVPLNIKFLDRHIM